MLASMHAHRYTLEAYASGPHITIPAFLEGLSALHFARLVPSPIQDASGLMLIAPSGSLKSQLLMHLQRAYPSSCIADSNWHYGKLLKMKAAFYNGTIRSIVVPEMSSIYAGDPRTGGRIEAMFMQMAGEGSVATNEKDSRWERYEMRGTIFAAMTPDFASLKHQFWEQGFHRRFLWAHLAMENEEVLLDYLTANKQADMSVPLMVEPPEHYIPSILDYKERMFIRDLLSPQKDFGPNHTRFAFLCRAGSALKWHYEQIRSKKSWKETFKEFAACLGRKAALLVIPPEPISVQYRKKMQRDAYKKQAPKKRKKKVKPTPIIEDVTA